MMLLYPFNKFFLKYFKKSIWIKTYKVKAFTGSGDFKDIIRKIFQWNTFSIMLSISLLLPEFILTSNSLSEPSIMLLLKRV